MDSLFFLGGIREISYFPALCIIPACSLHGALAFNLQEDIGHHLVKTNYRI